MASAIFISCEYKSPFEDYKERDLIEKLDLSADWIKDFGVTLEPTSDSSYSDAYYLNFVNLISKYSNFEEENISDLTDYWIPSPDSTPESKKPEIFEIVKASDVMSGNAFLHVKLQKNPEPQYVSYRFNTVKGKNYLFKFDYKCISGDGYQLSFSDDYDISSDNFKFFQQTNQGLVMIDINALEDSSKAEIRFGYKNLYSDAKALDFYIDNAALFPVSNVSISKELCIVDSEERTDDKTCEKFYEGVYKLSLNVKGSSSKIVSLRLGTRFKEYDISDSWSEITLEAQILKSHKYLSISIMPTVIDESRRFPGGIYITKPKLYFYPNKSSPD